MDASEKKSHQSKLLLALALLLLALTIAAVGVWLFTLRVGGRLYFCADVVDLRAVPLSCADYDDAHARKPVAVVRWSVPIGNERFDSFSESITLSSLPEDQLDRLAYFPELRRVDARDCRDSAALAAASRLYDGIEFLWTVGTSDGPIDGKTETLAVRAIGRDELETLVPLLPRLKTVDLRRAAMSAEDVDAFAAAHGELRTLFSVRVWGREVPGDSETLRLPVGASGDTEELLAAVRRLRSLKKLDLRDADIAPGQLARLLPLCEGVETDYVIRLCGATFTTELEELDLSGIEIDDLDELENAVRLMPKLKKVVMCDCGVPDEEMDRLNRSFEQIRFIWTVHFSVYSLRTDATMFCASDVPQLNYLAPELTDAQLAPIRYCTDLEALDLGHMQYTDLSFLYEMPHLKYLIMVEAKFSDITPIGSLQELEYLEIFLNRFSDISPLVNCRKLKHLNICYCTGFDPSPLKEMTWLKRLWYAGYGPVRGRELVEALPDTQVYVPFTDVDGSTGGGWRTDEEYYVMRDVFGMYYQPGGTAVHQ